ncbi:MAG: CDF family Co(II)/Ni(II) efflux transporter DmeF, partial [Proteobacteria bacterium]|nr:CDF family Co(II)/Ni(II) efflux transporter DmeF [Pseudomonadota bacterium]
MPPESLERWLHDHTFGQDVPRAGERRTVVVIAITAITMVVEIVAGVMYGSMALLADGLHMGSHASALGISAFAYYYTRRHATDDRFNFGTGKVNSLAGFASAVLLMVFALIMAWESVLRIINPVSIKFNQAILVAVLGFMVNGICLMILRGHRGHDHGAGGHDHHHHHAANGHLKAPADLRNDHNLWSAYLHVMADALTSLLAIFALLAGKYVGWRFLDPLMGLVGAALITRWSVGLIRSSSRVLLDMQAPLEVRRAVKQAIESEGDARLSDLHVWAVGPG